MYQSTNFLNAPRMYVCMYVCMYVKNIYVRAKKTLQPIQSWRYYGNVSLCLREHTDFSCALN